jgi:tetratricopeptide (TPR) repeat protein
VTTTPPFSDDPAGALQALLVEGRFQEALDIFRRLESGVPPDVQLLAATAATRLGDLRLGAALAEAAIERFRRRADDDGYMRALNLLGVNAFERGELERAESCFTTALGLARTLNDTVMTARVSNNLASLADLRGDSLAALSLYRNSLLSYQRLGDRRGAAESYHNLGIVFRQMGEWHDAEASSAQAVRHAELVGEPTLLGIAVMGRAEINLHRGDLDLAGQELGWAGKLASESGDELGLVEWGRLQALLHLAVGQYDAAAREAETARATAVHARASVLQAECAAAAARALKALGRTAEAALRHAEAVRLFAMQGAKRRLEDFEQAWSGQ